LRIANLLGEGQKLGVLKCALRSHIVAGFLNVGIEDTGEFISQISAVGPGFAPKGWGRITTGDGGAHSGRGTFNDLDVVLGGAVRVVELGVTDVACPDTLVDEIFKLVSPLDLRRAGGITSGLLLFKILKLCQ
jgi:hypothetical protein